MNTLILCRILYQICFHTFCPLETIYVSTIEVSSAHLNRLRRKEGCCFKIGQKQNLGDVNEQIREEIMRISSLITRRLFGFDNPKDTWIIL